MCRGVWGGGPLDAVRKEVERGSVEEEDEGRAEVEVEEGRGRAAWMALAVRRARERSEV